MVDAADTASRDVDSNGYDPPTLLHEAPAENAAPDTQLDLKENIRVLVLIRPLGQTKMTKRRAVDLSRKQTAPLMSLVCFLRTDVRGENWP